MGYSLLSMSQYSLPPGSWNLNLDSASIDGPTVKKFARLLENQYVIK